MQMSWSLYGQFSIPTHASFPAPGGSSKQLFTRWPLFGLFGVSSKDLYNYPVVDVSKPQILDFATQTMPTMSFNFKRNTPLRPK